MAKTVFHVLVHEVKTQGEALSQKKDKEFGQQELSSSLCFGKFPHLHLGVVTRFILQTCTLQDRISAGVLPFNPCTFALASKPNREKTYSLPLRCKNPEFLPQNNSLFQFFYAQLLQFKTFTIYYYPTYLDKEKYLPPLTFKLV